jgi:hypothetical protein
MTVEKKRRVLLLGLEDGLLWQMTRALVQEEPWIEYECAVDFSTAREMCTGTFYQYIVLDGWMQSWQAGYAVGWDEFSCMKPWKWIILVDSLPLGGVLDERISDAAVFLEKPFNPKEFPDFLRKLEAGRPQDAQEECCADEIPPVPPVSLEPGESYRTAEPLPGAVSVPPPVSGTEEPGEKETGAEDFHTCLEMGFSCLNLGDPAGARSFWEKALVLRPDDKRVQANLKRLERGKGALQQGRG